MATEKKVIDWEKIELDYRSGIKSLREIATDNEISEGAIRKRAKRDDWVRDLSAKIKAKAEDLVRKDLVRSEVRTTTAISEKETIDANAHQQAAVRLSQRKDIQRSRSITMKLFDELEHQVGVENAELLEQLGDIMRDEDEKGQDKLNDIYHKIISLPGRVKAAKDLSDAIKTLIGLERQAFGLDDKENTAIDPLQALLDRISQGNSSALSPVAQDKDYGN